MRSQNTGLALVECLRTVAKLDWDAIFDTLSKTDHILRQDPAGAYARMDADSRKRYHSALTDLAARSSLQRMLKWLAKL